MSYNSENLARIRREYETKHFIAEQEADRRREQLHARIPGLEELDRQIAMTGPRLIAIVLHKSQETPEQVKNEIKALRAQRDAILEKNGYPKDYSDIHYSCPKCQDSGYIDGRSMCSCMKKALVMAGYESSGIARLMENCRLDNFSLDYYRNDRDSFDNMSRVYEIICRYVANFTRSSPSLLFIGNTGLGKTHLSVAIAKELTDKGFDVLYTGSVGLFSDFENARFRNSVGTESGNSTDRYFDCELLLIDDLGTEVTNQFTVSCLYDLINRRKNLGLPTVINTNLNFTELGAKYTDRIVSRLFGDFMPLKFSGIDIRRQKLMK